ncbi:MAG: TetR/AcrR family transcriptional regulator [Candidatus Natronoplasma sp.]
MTKGDRKSRKRMIDAAERLFSEKGFSETSVDDICDEVGVAHGLFYYYFDTKGEMIEAITNNLIGEIESSLKEIVDDPELEADEKFIRFMNLAFQRKKKRPYLVSYFSKEDNPQLYHRLFEKSVEITTSYLTKIVEQGIEEDIFDTEYPEQTIRFWLNGRKFLMDKFDPLEEGIFEDMKAEAYILERLLGAENRFLTTFYQNYEEEIKEYIKKATRGEQDG